MFILKHIKMLQHVSIIIQIIFRELVYSLLKSLIINLLNCKKSMWWCGSITFGVCACSDPNYTQSSIPLHMNARTHTKCYAGTSPHWLFTFLTNFKISDFNKEHMSSLKVIWMMIETCWSIFMCFNMNILD